MTYLFPFSQVEKGSNVVLYGAGNVGADFASQIVKSSYCNIVCVLDKDYEKKDYWNVHVHPPEWILNETDYDYIVISLDSANITNKVYEKLVDFGVPESKIIRCGDSSISTKYVFLPKYVTQNANENIFRIGIFEGGGIGAAIMDTLFIKEVRKLFVEPVQIDFYCTGEQLFKTLPFLDNAYSKSNLIRESGYDLFITMNRFTLIDYINEEKTKSASPLFYEFCMDSKRMLENDFKFIVHSAVFSQYALVKGKNRIEHCNVNGILPFDRKTPLYMDWDTKAFELLLKYNLDKTEYITVSREVSGVNTENNPKLWPDEYYDRLLCLIKEKYPNIAIVNVGTRTDKPLENADIDLSGKTSLNDVKVILKYSLLHISPEGGLVHMKYFLNGISAVLFGPTSPKVYGYENNINLHGDGCDNCSEGCEAVSFNWTRGCVAGYEKAKCMESLFPEYVFNKISEFLDNRAKYDHRFKCFINEDELKTFLKSSKVAHIYRDNDALTLQNADVINELTIYDADLSINNSSDDFKNCLYMQCINKKVSNAAAEYGFIYNIPINNNSYDVIVNFTLAQEEYPFFAFNEMLRITRPGGLIIIGVNNSETNKLIFLTGETLKTGNLSVFEKIETK